MCVTLDTTHTQSQGDVCHVGHNKHTRHRVMSATLDTRKTHICHRLMSVNLDTTNTHMSQGDVCHFGHNKNTHMSQGDVCHFGHNKNTHTSQGDVCHFEHTHKKKHTHHRVMSATLDTTISPTCIKTCTFFKEWVFHKTLDENICMCFEEHMMQRREAWHWPAGRPGWGTWWGSVWATSHPLPCGSWTTAQQNHQLSDNHAVSSMGNSHHMDQIMQNCWVQQNSWLCVCVCVICVTACVCPCWSACRSEPIYHCTPGRRRWDCHICAHFSTSLMSRQNVFPLLGMACTQLCQQNQDGGFNFRSFSDVVWHHTCRNWQAVWAVP